MRKLVRLYAEAKSRADVDAALALCHEDFEITTVSLGIAARGQSMAQLYFHAFYAAFPDYRVDLEGHACGDEAVACWGTAHMSMQGEFLGVPPTGCSTSLPFFCVVSFKEGMIASELFFVDLASLCDGLGMSLETARARAAALVSETQRACW